MPGPPFFRAERRVSSTGFAGWPGTACSGPKEKSGRPRRAVRGPEDHASGRSHFRPAHSLFGRASILVHFNLIDAVNEHDTFLFVDFAQAHFDNLGVAGLHEAP